MMRYFTLAAITMLFVGAVHTTTPAARPTCAFNLPLNSSQCARWLNSPHHASGKSWSASAKGATLVYTSQPFVGVVDISALGPKGFKPAGTLALPSGSFPLGLTVDDSQRLYVAISTLTSGTPSVEVFPRGATTPSKIYTTGLSAPVDVAVDHHGTLYVANLAHAGGGGCAEGTGPGGNVIEYAKGSTIPTRTISGFPGCPSGVAVDSKANLYLTYLYYPPTGFAQSDVIEYPYGSTQGKALHLHVPGGPDLGGVAVTSTGELVVENDQDDATLNQILTFVHRSKKPTTSIQYGGSGWGTAFKFFALSGNRLFGSAYIAENLPFVVTALAEFDYPSGRELSVQKPTGTSQPFIYGVAVSPGK
jgi:hypothetical protein